MLLIRVSKEKALPFEVRVPNATTIKAMKEADAGKGKRFKTAEVQFKDPGSDASGHPLTGDWKHHRDLHIELDWLLICRIDGTLLCLDRTGSHSDLF